MKPRPRALWIAVCLALPLSSAAAQQSCDNSPSQIPTLLTVEGGGSLGVYEAGMTFTLVETFKRKWLGNANRALDRLPPLCLSIATGASAGSINAFIAATNWCDARLTALPEESTFWRTWVTTGIMQLLPIRGEEEAPDSAVFARRHFDGYIEPELRKAWRNANWVPNCHVEFGATATRMYADTLQGIGWLAARNQRMAFALTVRGVDGSGAPIVRQFLPETRLQRGSFGSLNTLPGVRGDTVPWKDVFDLLKASSSFPVAFQPLQLNYCTYQEAAELGTLDGCGQRALVLDGGVFDNAPLSLTYLLSFSHNLQPMPTTLLFLTPDRMRIWEPNDSRDIAREPVHAAAGTSPYGLEQLAQLVGEMIPTAREYELQIAGRVVPMELYLRLNEGDRQRMIQQQGRPNAPVAPPNNSASTVGDVATTLNGDFRATARWHPLTGDWIGGFGAFLGRPMREYDFYVGMYDAFVLLAENLLCQERRKEVYAQQMAASAAPFKQCVRNEVDALIAQPPIPLSGVARRTLKALHHDEFDRGRGGQPLARSVAARMTPEDSVFIVVDAVREALRDARVTDSSKAKKPRWYSPRSLLAARHCAKLGVANAMFCNSKLVAFFDSLDTDRAARGILLRWASEGECSVRSPFTSLRNALQVTDAWKQPDKCRVEQSFVNTMRDPEGNLYELSRQVLGRLSERTPRGGMGSASSALFYIHATVGDRHRRQADIGRSTIPLDAPKKTLYYLLPSSWGLTPNIRGLGEIGWEVRRHLSATPLALSFPLHLRPASQIGTDGARDHLLVVQGARLEHKALFLSTRAGFQADFWCRPSDGLERCYKGYTPGAFVSVFGKVNVSFTKVPRGLPEYKKQNSSILTFGLGDLNGLAYWMTHK